MSIYRIALPTGSPQWAEKQTRSAIDLDAPTAGGYPNPLPFLIVAAGRRDRSMRRCGRNLLFLLILAPLAGCLSAEPVGSTAWLTRRAGFQGAAGADLVQMNVAILDVGVGDPYVNEELWGLADEQHIPADKKALLRENGLRIGQIRGITPPGLQSLLTSQRSNPSPRLKQLRAGDACSIDLGPSMPQCRLVMREDGRPTLVEMANAQPALEITPTLTPEGNVCLQFKPQIGPGGLPAQRLNGLPLWMVLTQRPTRKFDNLCWEVTLQSNEYVVIGGRLDQTDSFGQRSFLSPDEPKPVQRLLVIRTARVLPELLLDDLGQPNDEAIRQRPPLALQAAWSSFRSDSP